MEKEGKVSKAAKMLRSKLRPELTIRDIAAYFGISRQAVDAWSRGIAMPNEDRMIELQAQFGIPMKHWKVAG